MTNNGVGISNMLINAVNKRPTSPLNKSYEFMTDLFNIENCYQSKMSFSRDLSKPNKIPLEIFSSMVILDLLFDSDINPQIISSLKQYITKNQKDGIFWFFEDKDLLSADVDCTSIGLSVLHKMNSISLNEHTKKSVIDKIISNTQQDGIIQVYFTPCKGRENRIDPVVCANALCLIYLVKRGTEAKKTEDYVYQILETKEYLNDTRYYHSPDTFLYFLSRAVKTSSHLQDRFSYLLSEHVLERTLSQKDRSSCPLDLVMRILASKNLGIDDYVDLKKIITMQKDNGSWQACALYKTGRDKNQLYFGGESLTTAFAIRALIDTLKTFNKLDSDIQHLEYSLPAVIQNSEVMKQLELRLYEWITKYDFFNDDKKRRHCARASTAFVKYCSPSNSDKESLFIGGLYLSIFFYLNIFVFGKDLKEIKQICDCITNVSSVVMESKIIKGMKNFRKKIMDIDHTLLSTYNRYFKMMCNAYTEEPTMKSNPYNFSLKDYIRLRRHIVAVFPYIFLWCMLKNFKISISADRSDSISKITQVTVDIIYMQNDLISVQNDVKDKKLNYVFFLERELSCTRSKAIEITKFRYHEKLQEFMKLEKMLISDTDIHPNDTKQYLNFLKSLCVGNQLTSIVERNHRYEGKGDPLASEYRTIK